MRQAQVLVCIQQFVVAHGYPPSVREIGAVLGMRSTSTVQAHLNALERKGAIQRFGGVRTIRVTGLEVCPLCGTARESTTRDRDDVPEQPGRRFA